jgi:hypothetical protein
VTNIVRDASIMPNDCPEFRKLMTDILDEIIPTLPVDAELPALIADIGNRILKAAAEEQM